MPYYTTCPFCGSSEAVPHSIRFIRNYPHSSRSKCRQCGLVYANPIATKEELIDFYQSYYEKDKFKNEHYKERALKNFQAIEKLSWENFAEENKFTLNYYGLKRVSSGNYLDVGCGVGNALILADKCNYNIFGTEYDKDAIQFDKELLPHANIFHGDVVDAKYETNFFDYILFYHVIEHVQDPKSVLLEIFRILKPGGTLFIGTPNISNVGYKLYRILQLLTFRMPSIVDGVEHTVVFSKKTLANIVNQCGFKILRHKGEAHTESWSTIFKSKDSNRKKLIRILEKIFLVNQRLTCTK